MAKELSKEFLEKITPVLVADFHKIVLIRNMFKDRFVRDDYPEDFELYKKTLGILIGVVSGLFMATGRKQHKRVLASLTEELGFVYLHELKWKDQHGKKD